MMFDGSANVNAPDKGALEAAHNALHPAIPSRVKPFDEDLRARLANYRKTRNLSNADLGRELGVSDTAVSKYLNGKPEGDVFRLEAVASDVLRAAARPRAKSTVALADLGLVRPVAAVLDAISRTGDRGVVTAAAGAGMTCAVQHYLLHHRAAVGLTAAQFARHAGDVLSGLWSAVETRGWDQRSPRVDFLRDHLRGSRRLLVIDRAGRLTSAARLWLRDFSEDTGCPLALCGGPDLMTAIQADPQGPAAWGHARVVKTKDVPAAARHLVERQFPGGAAPEALLALAARVATGSGGLHALDIQLRLTADLLADAKLRDRAEKAGRPAEEFAFGVAHTQLLRPYALDGQGTLALNGEGTK